MRKKIFVRGLVSIFMVLFFCGTSMATGVEDFFNNYYRTLEGVVLSGNTNDIEGYIDANSNYGKEMKSWIVRLSNKGIEINFNEVQIGEVAKAGDVTEVRVSDVMTMVYPDEMVKSFSYNRVYSLAVKGESYKIIDERDTFSRVFPGENKTKTAKISKKQTVKTLNEVVAGKTIAPVSFLPALADGDVSFLLRWDDPVGEMEEFAIKSISSSDLSDIKEEIPPVAEGAISFYVKGSDVPRVFAAVRPLEGVSPSEALRIVVTSFAEMDDIEFTIKPYKGNLRAELEPLSLIEFPEEDDAPSLYSALWKGDNRTVLISLSDSGLNDMVDAVSGKLASVDGVSRFDGKKLFQMKLNVSNKMLRDEVVEEDGLKLYSKKPLSFESALVKSPSAVSFELYSNLVDLFVDPSVGKSFTSIGSDLPFFGGKIIGVVAARLKRIDKDFMMSTMKSQLSERKMYGFNQACVQFEQMTGLTVDDVLDLIGGRFSVTLGSRSRSPIGDVPGVYLQIEPDNKAVLAKIAEALPRIYKMVPPVGVSPLNVKGWSSLYGMNGMASVSVGVDKDRLLIGAVDYEKLNSPYSLPKNIGSVLKEENLAVLAISISDLSDAVRAIANQNSIFLQDPEIKEGIDLFLKSAETLSDLVLRVKSTHELSISVGYLENSK